MTKFLQSATTKTNALHPEYRELHGNMATDGCRVHRDNSLPSLQDGITRRINDCGLIPTQPRNRATVSRLDLVIACRRALALRDPWDRNNNRFPALTFCMNGSLLYSAQNEEVGTIHAEIVDGIKVNDKVKTVKNGLKYETHAMIYKHHNTEKVVSFALNPKYLLDALEGMKGETVDIDIPAPRAPFYMTDGICEAVIMPICI